MKFRLEGGSYVNGNKKYVKGDVIESDQELDKIFACKFTKLYEEQATVTTPKYKAPDIPVPQSPVVTATEPGKEETVAKDVKTDAVEESEPGKVVGLGEDVTDEYPTAKEVGVRIFKDKKSWHTVVDEDGDVLNKTKLRANKVQAYIGQFMEE